MFGFTQFLPTGPAFPQCTACSSPVIQLFKVWICTLYSIAFHSPIPQSRQSAKLFASFFSRRRNWDAPTPSPAGQFVFPVFGSGGGGGGTVARGRGGGGVQIPTRGHTLWYFVTNPVTPGPFFLSFSWVSQGQELVLQIRVRVRLIFGSWIWIRNKVKSRIRIRIKVKTKSCGGSKWRLGGPKTLPMEAWRLKLTSCSVSNPVDADSHHF